MRFPTHERAMSVPAAVDACGVARGRRKYVPVGALLAIHGSQRPGERHRRPWLPGQRPDEATP
jgi:hypothetical protein